MRSLSQKQNLMSIELKLVVNKVVLNDKFVRAYCEAGCFCDARNQSQSNDWLGTSHFIYCWFSFSISYINSCQVFIKIEMDCDPLCLFNQWTWPSNCIDAYQSTFVDLSSIADHPSCLQDSRTIQFSDRDSGCCKLFAPRFFCHRISKSSHAYVDCDTCIDPSPSNQSNLPAVAEPAKNSFVAFTEHVRLIAGLFHNKQIVQSSCLLHVFESLKWALVSTTPSQSQSRDATNYYIVPIYIHVLKIHTSDFHISFMQIHWSRVFRTSTIVKNVMFPSIFTINDHHMTKWAACIAVTDATASIVFMTIPIVFAHSFKAWLTSNTLKIWRLALS